jgi:hypothetical protein
MNPPASAPCAGDVAERSEDRYDGAGAAGAFPWLTDTTRTSTGDPPTPAPVSPIARVESVNSLSHEVLIILKRSVGKAVVLWQPADSPLQRLREQRAACMVDQSTGQLVDPVTGEIVASSEWSKLDPAAQLAECEARANQRAKSEMSDYMVHNRLTMMWVLTNADELHGADGRKEMMARTAEFMRKLRKSHFRGRPFPYTYSPELHPGGHGWHCNVFLQRGYIDKKQMDRLWGHGNTWFTDFTVAREDHWGRKIARSSGAPSEPRGGVRSARTAASYASKYPQKDWDSDHLADGSHRYERSQGFNVPEDRFRAATFADALAALMHHPAVGNVNFMWTRESGVDGWFGPNMTGICFDNRPVPKRASRRPSSEPTRAVESQPPEPLRCEGLT